MQGNLRIDLLEVEMVEVEITGSGNGLHSFREL